LTLPWFDEMKDLILATSFGYSYEQLRPFLGSLKETDFAGEIVLFIGNTSLATQSRLRRDGVKLVSFFYPFKRAHKMRNPLYRVWPLVHRFLRGIEKPETLASLSAPFHNISTLRYLLYHRFLRSRPGEYRAIFLTDLRDVCFQSNPFARGGLDQLRFFEEEPPHTVGSCPNNSRWIREFFGEDALQELAAQPIICSGTTLGDYASILDYLGKFILTFRQARSIMRVGADQGIHNFLARTQLASAVTLCPNRESEVLTMGLMPREEKLPRNERGQLIDRHGVPYAVLHQFDRHADLNDEILSRYRI
jgi:hypothetical protein